MKRLKVVFVTVIESFTVTWEGGGCARFIRCRRTYSTCVVWVCGHVCRCVGGLGGWVGAFFL
jgi:hypothetical protein